MSKMKGLLAALLSIITLTAYAEDTTAPTFSMTTTAFLDEGIMPVLYTCDGKDVSPQLDWSSPPAKTESFALVMTDPKAPAGTFYHWVIFNIPKNTTSLPEGMPKPPTGATTGINSWEKAQYNGPCPPKGSTHQYIITLYALDKKLDLSGKSDGKSVLDAMKDHVIGETKLTGVYSRWLK